jgi:type IV fimbrial biogenesis protein FimT
MLRDPAFPVSAPARRRIPGFTLIEMMIVLVIVAVLLMIALPSFNVLSLRTKLKSHANDMVASVYLARSEAIKRNATMTMCIANSDGDDCAGAGDWDQGWIVMDPNDLVIKWQQAASSDIKVFGLSSIDTLTFQPSGLTSTAATIYLCPVKPTSGVEERQVLVSATGRPRVDRDPGTTHCP